MARRSRNGRALAAVTPRSIGCAIYCRKSTSEGLDRDFTSLDAQRQAAEDYIRSQRHEGWEALPDRYDDGGYSGGNVERPALRRLLSDVETGRIGCVVVYKYDRLSRSMLDFLQILHFFEKHRVAFVSVTQQFNTATPVGRMTMNVLASFGEFERDIISERTRDKMQAARRKGKWTGGMPPLGYDVAPEGGKLVVNKEEADQVKVVFHLYTEIPSLVAVSQELNRRGWRRKSWKTKSGKWRNGNSWDAANLHRVLCDPIYIGKVKLGDEVFPGEHKAIVPKALFDKVQATMKRNRGNGGSSARNRNSALLRGLLRCKFCDAGMVHTWTKKKDRLYRYYTCHAAIKNGRATCPTKSIPAADVEKFVIDRIRIIGFDKNLQRQTFREALRQVRAERRSLRAEAKRLAGQADQARKEVERLVSTAGKASGEAQKALLKGLEKAQSRLSTVEARLQEIRTKEAELGPTPVDETDLGRTLKAFDPIWDVLHTPEKERILRLLIERIDYDGKAKDLSITFRLTGITALTTEEGSLKPKS
jgi:site-specific DNA recombinase